MCDAACAAAAGTVFEDYVGFEDGSGEAGEAVKADTCTFDSDCNGDQECMRVNNDPTADGVQESDKMHSECGIDQAIKFEDGPYPYNTSAIISPTLDACVDRCKASGAAPVLARVAVFIGVAAAAMF